MTFYPQPRTTVDTVILLSAGTRVAERGRKFSLNGECVNDGLLPRADLARDHGDEPVTQLLP